MKRLAGGLLTALLLAACTPAPAPEPSGPVYPDSRQQVRSNTWHGIEVSDRWRWLEHSDSEEVTDWLAAQNALSERALAEADAAAAFATHFQSLRHEVAGVPMQGGGRYVWPSAPGDGGPGMLWQADDPAGTGTVLIDGDTPFGPHVLSPDGLALAWAASATDADWQRWRVRDLLTGADNESTLEGATDDPVAWTPDSRGFFYTRWPTDANGAWDTSQQPAIWYHRTGSAQSRDTRIFTPTSPTARRPLPGVTADGRYLLIALEDEEGVNGIWYQRLGPTPASGRLVRMLDDIEGDHAFLGSTELTFYFRTTHEAPNGQVIAINLDLPDRENWRIVVPEQADLLHDAVLAGGRLVLNYLDRDSGARVQVHDLAGQLLRMLELPGAGMASRFSATAASSLIFFHYEGLLNPPAVWGHDVNSGETTQLRSPALELPADEILVERLEWRQDNASGRGPVQLTLMRRHDVPTGTEAPLLLTVARPGGMQPPRWSAASVAWVLNGGVHAQVVVAGSQADAASGTAAELLAATDWLVERGYGDPGRVAVYAEGEAGQVAALAAGQRPERYAALLLLDVPFDGLRSGPAQSRGAMEDPAAFSTALAGSPYHQLHEDQCHPATLLISSRSAAGVAPWHSYKYAAALQNSQRCAEPILLESRPGPGDGKPPAARHLAFLLNAMKAQSTP